MSSANLTNRMATAAAASLIAITLAGCGDREKTTAANATAPAAAPADGYAAGGPGAGGNATSVAAMTRDAGSDADLLKALPASKHTLVEAIQAIEKAGEAPTAAKFEYEDGALHLAVYSSAKGTKTDAEHNVLKEHKGDPLQAKWTPKVETFADVEHVSRAAEYHTLMELSPPLAARHRHEGAGRRRAGMGDPLRVQRSARVRRWRAEGRPTRAGTVRRVGRREEMKLGASNRIPGGQSR